LEEGILTERSFKLIGAGIGSAALESAASRILAAKQEFLETFKKVGARIGADFGKMFGNGLESTKLSALNPVLPGGKTRLHPWYSGASIWDTGKPAWKQRQHL